MVSRPEKDRIDSLFADGAQIDAALKKAVRLELSRRKKLGHSAVVWRDGKIVVLPPERIPDDESRESD